MTFNALGKNCLKTVAIKRIETAQKQPPEGFCKKALLKNFTIFTEKHLRWSLFLIKLPVFLLKRNSNTGVFLWMLRNFLEQLFEEHLLRLLLTGEMGITWVRLVISFFYCTQLNTPIRRCSEERVLKKFAKFPKIHKKTAVSEPLILSKRDSNTVVFL